MLRVPLLPKDLDGPLRVIVLARAAGNQPDVALERVRLKRFVGDNYDWPLEFRLIASRRPGGISLRRVQRLLGAGDWDVLMVDGLDRLTRSRRRFFQFMDFCAAASIRVISPADDFDTANKPGFTL